MVEAIALEAVAGGSIPSTLTINIKFENILIFLYNIYIEVERRVPFLSFSSLKIKM